MPLPSAETAMIAYTRVSQEIVSQEGNDENIL
jgi:hypothetical protein